MESARDGDPGRVGPTSWHGRSSIHRSTRWAPAPGRLMSSARMRYPQSTTTGRGGQVTYHGPGQRVVYLMLDLKKRARTAMRAAEPDLRRLCAAAGAMDHPHPEGTVWHRGFHARGASGRVGAYALTGEAKIAALGVRVQKWVTSHGIALNLQPRP
jgi:lipoate-protein ligase B